MLYNKIVVYICKNIYAKVVSNSGGDYGVSKGKSKGGRA